VNTVTTQNPPGFADPSSNSATDTDDLTPSANLSITKAGPPVVVPGNPVQYTLTVTNDGPSAAADVVVTDPTPPGLTFVSAAGACTGAFPCNIGSLAAGASRTITATFLVPAGYLAPNPIVQTATVSSPTPDPNSADNSMMVETPVDATADVAVTKQATPDSALAGDTVSFVVRATNGGPNAASGVVVSDVLPAGLVFVSAAPAPGTDTAPSGGRVGGRPDARELPG